jgi:hypothetical protein
MLLTSFKLNNLIKFLNFKILAVVQKNTFLIIYLLIFKSIDYFYNSEIVKSALLYIFAIYINPTTLVYLVIFAVEN